MALKASLGEITKVASLAKNKKRLLGMPLTGLTQAQAFEWPLCGLVERDPNNSAKWRMTKFGLAVRKKIERGLA